MSKPDSQYTSALGTGRTFISYAEKARLERIAVEHERVVDRLERAQNFISSRGLATEYAIEILRERGASDEILQVVAEAMRPAEANDARS